MTIIADNLLCIINTYSTDLQLYNFSSNMLLGIFFAPAVAFIFVIKFLIRMRPPLLDSYVCISQSFVSNRNFLLVFIILLLSFLGMELGGEFDVMVNILNLKVIGIHYYI